MICGYDLSDPVRDLDPDFKYWNPISDSVVEDSIKNLNYIMEDNEGIFNLISIYTSAFEYFIENKFGIAIVIYWATIEACLNVEHFRLHPLKRLKNNSSSRTPRANDLLNVLSRNQKIENDFLDKLKEVKNLRDAWIHNPHYFINEKQTLDARHYCEKILFQVFSIDIKETISGTGGAGGGMFRDVFSQRYPLKSNLFNRGE